MKILVLNCGSSSIKYQLFDMTDQRVISKGGVEKLGMKGSFLKHTREDGQVVLFEGEIIDHKIGIEYILGILTSEKHGCLKSLDEIDAVGHRVVHGGRKVQIECIYRRGSEGCARKECSPGASSQSAEPQGDLCHGRTHRGNPAGGRL